MTIEKRVVSTYSEEPELVQLEKKQMVDWGNNLTQAPSAWAKTRGKNMKVAVLDTGVDQTHPDLIGNLKILMNTDDMESSDVSDVNGHGTHVAGIIGATDNNKGVVGVAPDCDLYVFKVLGNDGSGSFESITRAIEVSIEQKVDIISMSLGSSGEPPKAFHDAIKMARDAGIIMIAATGNENEHVGWPAAYEEVIAVGANNQSLERAAFSNFGSEVDVMAGGVDIISTYPKKRYAKMSGTSMATPIVTGCIALALSYAKEQGFWNEMTPNAIRDYLHKASVKIDTDKETEQFGHGIVNVFRLIDVVNGDLK